MSSGARLTLVSLAAAVAFLAAATTVVPVRVRLHPRSVTCHTVVRQQRDDPITSALCGRAGAYRLRATLAIAALLVVLSLLPLVLRRRSQRLVWAGVTITVALVSVALLAVAGVRWENVFFDL